MVNSKHVDCPAVPACRPASAAVDNMSADLIGKKRKTKDVPVGRVPPSNSLSTANVGKVSNVPLNLPAIFPHDAVDAIRASDEIETALGVIVADVVGDCVRRGTLVGFLMHRGRESHP